MLIRSIFRVAELSSGFSSPLCEIRSEKMKADSVDLDFKRRAKQGKGSTGRKNHAALLTDSDMYE
jgi:hypothetical protein